MLGTRARVYYALKNSFVINRGVPRRVFHKARTESHEKRST